jgi:lipoate-protein ligase A
MGGTELSGAILFQGTILVDFDVDEMLRALRIPTEKLQDKEIESVKDRVTCLKWELGKIPLYSTIKESFLRGFSETFKVRFEEKSLTDEEKSLLRERISRFSSEDYIFKVREALPTKKTISSILKAPGGIIRVSMVVDIKRKIINQVLITGDFFAYPKRTIFDLESRLKNSKASISELREDIKSFFSETHPIIPGFKPNHFIQAIEEALQKMDLIPHGFDEEETHHLYPVIKPFDQVKKPEVLLLPYCAKKIDCEYRFKEGCSECGLCSIGDAIKMARSFNMDFLTIQNYEALESTLKRLKQSKVQGFIGSCCEPFYGKHRPDFERIGLPGILIDLKRTTCYDLGKEEVAFKGKFENQTELDIQLLKKVLEFSYG